MTERCSFHNNYFYCAIDNLESKVLFISVHEATIRTGVNQRIIIFMNCPTFSRHRACKLLDREMAGKIRTGGPLHVRYFRIITLGCLRVVRSTPSRHVGHTHTITRSQPHMVAAALLALGMDTRLQLFGYTCDCHEHLSHKPRGARQIPCNDHSFFLHGSCCLIAFLGEEY